MEALTEQRIVPRPVVYGFLRLPAGALPRADALRHALTAYCARHELALSGVFTEHTTSDAGPAAFTALLDALTVPGGYGVVIPSPAHLGPRQQASARADEIRRTGAVVISLRDSAQSPPPPLPRPARRYAMPAVQSPPLHELHAQFPAARVEVRRMRVIAKERAREWGLDSEAVDDIVLAVSELVTNAIQHVGLPGHLHITHYAVKVRVEVEDGSPATPPLAARTVSTSQERGRGLPIIDKLSEKNWGVRPGRNGKTTWCEIELLAGGVTR
ncbi:ATP-binding protein [Streptomyces sp. NPDC047315]|uniref:ATP-binding protein n=1 Tax=Streptomyces sp. NPDC047315 TaxID=3155142 RepID=UPI0034001452